MTDRPAYDYERNKWVPQCPYGDVCTGCDALGHCTRVILTEAEWRANGMTLAEIGVSLGAVPK